MTGLSRSRFWTLALRPLQTRTSLRKGLPTRPETWFPLRVLSLRACWLVQTEDYAGREMLFASDYAYFSLDILMFSMVQARRARTCDEIIQRLELGANSLVAEIAANDGYLLQFMQAKGIPCYGVEPPANTAAEARKRKRRWHIIGRFFDSRSGTEQ